MVEGVRTIILGVRSGRRRILEAEDFLGPRELGVRLLKGETCIWGVRRQMVRVWELGGAVIRRETLAAIIMETVIIIATATATTTTIVAVGDAGEEESGGEVGVPGATEEIEEVEEIGVSEETEAEGVGAVEEIGGPEVAEGAGVAELVAEAEGHGVVKETKLQTHITRRSGAKLPILP